MLEQAVAPGAQGVLRTRSEKDADLTDILTSPPWPEAEEKLRTWVTAHAAEPDLQLTRAADLLEVYKNILRDQDTPWPTGR